MILVLGDGMMPAEFDVDIETKEIKKVSDKGGNETHHFNIKKGDKILANYSLVVTHENGREWLQFPEKGNNWGRYGSRDAGGDNWVNKEVAAAFFGLLYDLEDSPGPLTGEKILFDDIFGNGGKDIGHKTHRTGDDIDLRYPGAGEDPNINGSTNWSTIEERQSGTKISVLITYQTDYLLRKASDWGFKNNYVFPQNFPNTKNSEHHIHRHHIHIGLKKMKNLFIYTILLIFISSCNSYQKSHIDSGEAEMSCEYTNPIKTLGIGMLVWKGECNIYIYEDTSTSKAFSINICEDFSGSICPYFYKPDYEIVHFIVNSEFPDFYEILYNYDKKGYIKKDSIFQFKLWSEYLIDLPIRAKSKIDDNEFEILKVSSDSLLTKENKWVKWRDNNQLLIEFYFLM